MKKNAFTLIELLSVLTLIAVISLITVPIVSISIKKSQASLYKNQEQNILDGAIAWAEANSSSLPVDNDSDNISIAITLGLLKANGYINTNLKNPQTGYLYPNDLIINISYHQDSNYDNSPNIKYNGHYKFEIDEETVQTDLELTKDVPSINLNICGSGGTNEQNNNFINDCINNNFDKIYEGYSNISGTHLSFYKNNKEQLANNELVTYNYKGNNVVSFDMSKYGFYYVYYNKDNLEDIDRDTLKIFMINDLEAPEIKFNKYFKTQYSIWDVINLANNVECIDNSGYCTLKTSGNIIPGVAGKYVITYVAKDNNGNTVKQKRVISIK